MISKIISFFNYEFKNNGSLVLAVFKLFKLMHHRTTWYFLNYFKIRSYGLHCVKNYSKIVFDNKSTQEILSIAKHEAHRIEKACYAGYLKSDKLESYKKSHKNLAKILDILNKRGIPSNRNDIIWLNKICDSFHNIESFLKKESLPPPVFDRLKLASYISIAKSRRSVRSWSKSNFSNEDLLEIAKDLIDCAKWSPCSGNRQPWFFKVLIKESDKSLLVGIKEMHCISAPLIIFVGIRKCSYGAIGNREQGIFVDGAAATMQMVMAAHQAGLGSCWNHFCKDFLYSRPKNIKLFNRFYNQLGISDDIEPISLVAFGIPTFMTMVPERPPAEDLCPDF
jgi:nitroreductase